VSAESAFFFLLAPGLASSTSSQQLFRRRRAAVGPEVREPHGPASTPIYTTVSTATSGLSANIYF